jgi:hypothetical protein
VFIYLNSVISDIWFKRWVGVERDGTEPVSLSYLAYLVHEQKRLMDIRGIEERGTENGEILERCGGQQRWRDVVGSRGEKMWWAAEVERCGGQQRW